MEISTMQEIEYEKTLYMKSPHKFFGDALNDLPDNVYLNKTTTGSGATHICLSNDVNYVVIVPYKSAIINKTEGNPNILPVMQGIDREDITSYVCSNIFNVKKIMTTYDSFYKVYEILKAFNMLNKFKLCVDEAHVLVSLAKIKGKAFNFLYKHFREFKSFVFVTATPNDRTLIPKPIRDVEFVRVIWESAEKVVITEQRVKNVSECNKHVIEICKQHLLGEVDGNAYIFYNSVAEIISVIQKLKKMEDFSPDNVNVFCAENPHNDKKISLQLGKEYLNGSFKDFKKINFLTSANYESCDILDKDGRTYIIVSSKRNSTALTNHLAVVQASGRLRVSKYKLEAKMIVCGFNEDIYQKKYEEFVSTIDKMEATAKHLIARSLDSLNQGYEDAYLKDIDSFATNPFIVVNDDLTLELNDGARLSEMQTYQAFNSHITTLPNSDVGNTVRLVDDNMLVVSDEARLLVDEKVDFSRLMKNYINAINSNDIGVVEMIEQRSEIHKQYVNVLGVDRILSIGLNKTKLTNAYNLAVKFSESNMKVKNLLKIKVGGRYTSYDIINKLQSAYDEVGIERKAVSNDIKNYYNVAKVQVVSDQDGKRKQGFHIISDIYKDE